MRNTLLTCLLGLLGFTLTGQDDLCAAERNLPGLILGGELSNSAATSVADIDEVMPRMAALGLNTVLVPAYWEFIEPVEGRYDFMLVDRVSRWRLPAASQTTSCKPTSGPSLR